MLRLLSGHPLPVSKKTPRQQANRDCHKPAPTFCHAVLDCICGAFVPFRRDMSSSERQRRVIIEPTSEDVGEKTKGVVEPQRGGINYPNTYLGS